MNDDSSIIHSLKNPILAVISSYQEGPYSIAPISAAGILGPDLVNVYIRMMVCAVDISYSSVRPNTIFHYQAET